MWELDYKESWVLKNWCFWTVVLEKTLESPLDCKEIQLVHPKGDQSWVFTGWTDVEAETPILWPPDVKSWLIWKDPDAGKDWEQEEKGMTEDEMVDGIINSVDISLGKFQELVMGQGGLVCCSSWGHKELDITEWLNWTVHFGGNIKWYGHYGKQYGDTSKTKNKTTISSSSPTSGYISRGNKINIWKRYLQLHIHCSIIYNNRAMEIN